MAESGPGGAPPRRAMSIASRIITGYAIKALLTLSAAALFLLSGMRDMFTHEDRERLSDCVLSVRHAVAVDPLGLSAARRVVQGLAGERDVEQYYVRLLDTEGLVRMETPGIHQLDPGVQNFPAPPSSPHGLSEIRQMASPGGTAIFIASALISRGDDPGPLTCQVVLNVSHIETLMARYRNRLILTVLGTVAVGTLMGWWITRRSLRPLEEMADKVRRVTAEDLDERIGGREWPRELSSLAEEFDAMLRRLRGSFEQLSRFTADAAHEFRTPLNNLMGATGLALSRPRAPEEYRSLLESNLEEFQRLNSMMERLLFLARADEGGATLNLQPLRASDMLHSVAEFFSALAEERGVEVLCSGEAEIFADPVMVRMALTNLVSNALRHTPRGGRVHLSAAPGEQGGAVICVRDNGPGIPAEHRPHLFDRFYRADESRGAPGGTGLGLAIVQTILRLHGGTVELESTGGAVFHLNFPAS